MNFTASYMDGFFVVFLPFSALLVFFIVKSIGWIAECRRIMSFDKWTSGNYVGRNNRYSSQFVYSVNGVEYVHILRSKLFLPFKRTPYKIYYDPTYPKRSCIKKLSVRGHIADIVMSVLLLIAIFFVPLLFMICS